MHAALWLIFALNDNFIDFTEDGQTMLNVIIIYSAKPYIATGCILRPTPGNYRLVFNFRERHSAASRSQKKTNRCELRFGQASIPVNKQLQNEFIQNTINFQLAKGNTRRSIEMFCATSTHECAATTDRNAKLQTECTRAFYSPMYFCAQNICRWFGLFFNSSPMCSNISVTKTGTYAGFFSGRITL